MKRLLTYTAIACATSFSAAAEVRINGFANLVGGITSSDDAVFGYDDRFDFDSDSLFAIQVSGDINDRMTATGQIVAKGENDYDPKFEWAYLTYQASDKVAVSAGRLRLPLFRYSASKDVGYSYHWVAAPRTVYDVAFNNIDGFRVDYNNYAGDWEYNIQGVIGTLETDTGGGTLSSDNTIVVSAEGVYESFKLRAVAGRGTAAFSTPTVDTAIGGLRQAGLTTLADKVAIEDDTAVFLGLGLEYDNFDYFISAEITSIEIENSFSPKDTAYYVTAGMRLGKFTPSLTYESLDGASEEKFLDDVAQLPAAVQPTATAVVLGLQGALAEEYDVLTFGVRYDMDTNVALKADVSKYSDEIDSDMDATLVRFAVNYVF